LGEVAKKHYKHLRYLFGNDNLKIQGASFQKIRVWGLAPIQVALEIVLKIDQPSIALAHMLSTKEWKETKLKARRTPTM
jgi:hypothetical protein